MFTELFTWQVLLIIGIIWLFTDFAWVSRWKELLARISKLFSAPWVFAKDPTPDRHPAYPREFIEQLAQAELPAAKADDGSVNSLTHWWKSLSSRVLGEVSPLISIGHVLSLVFFVFFIYADAVTVANTLVLIGVQSPDLPHLLTRLDLAILGGALVSATVGVWIMVEMLGKGEFITTAEYDQRAEKGLWNHCLHGDHLFRTGDAGSGRAANDLSGHLYLNPTTGIFDLLYPVWLAGDQQLPGGGSYLYSGCPGYCCFVHSGGCHHQFGDAHPGLCSGPGVASCGWGSGCSLLVPADPLLGHPLRHQQVVRCRQGQGRRIAKE